ncbi:MAG: alpha/beta fold hydrolase [Sandaracinaceae bacterium]
MKRATLPKGIELCYEEFGEGEPLVMIMGIGAQMIYWPADLCRMIADEGFRVIRFDNRDIGESSWLDDLEVPPMGWNMFSALFGLRAKAPYTLADMADDTAQLLDFLGHDSAHVVGASMGGMIAQTMGYTHPERVRSLTSIMSTTGATGHYMTEPHALRALLSGAPKTRDEAVENAARLFGVIGSPDYELDFDEVRGRAGKAFDRGFHPVGFLRQFAAIAASGDRTAHLRFVRAPTHVIHGAKDPLIRPIGGRLTARAIEGATLDVIDGMGHDMPRALWPHYVKSIVRVAKRGGFEAPRKQSA